MSNTTRKVPKFLQQAYKAVQKNLGYGNVTANNLKKMKNEANAAYAVEKAAENAAKAAAAANAAAQATAMAAKEIKKCGKKPLAWLGTQKNPAFAEWNACVKSGGIAAGGRRKTQRRKSHRRRTHKRH